MRALKMRESPSVVPPGAAGVTNRIGRDGPSAADAADAATKAEIRTTLKVAGKRI